MASIPEHPLDEGLGGDIEGDDNIKVKRSPSKGDYVTVEVDGKIVHGQIVDFSDGGRIAHVSYGKDDTDIVKVDAGKLLQMDESWDEDLSDEEKLKLFADNDEDAGADHISQSKEDQIGER